MKGRVTWPSATLLVVGNMIGAGAFTTSGFALAELGSPGWVLLAWAVGGGIALSGALAYGGLARAFPESGGEYALLRRLGYPRAGHVAGWVSILTGFTAPIAVAALGLEAYWLGDAADPGRPWLGTAAIGVCALLHGLRVRVGLRVQNLAVSLKLLGILLLVAIVLLRRFSVAEPLAGPFESLSFESLELGAWPGAGPFAVVLIWVSFAFSGWNAAIYIAGEIDEPERRILPVLVLGTAVVLAAYLALNASMLLTVPPAALRGRAEVAAIAAGAVGGPALRHFAALVVGLALFTSISSMMMAGPRVIAAMAEAGHLPSWLARDTEAPRPAIALQAGLAWLALWLGDLVGLLSYIGLTLGLCAMAIVAGAMRLRAREGAAAVTLPGYPFVPALFVGATLATSIWMGWREPWHALASAGTLAVGVAFHPRVARTSTVPESVARERVRFGGAGELSSEFPGATEERSVRRRGAARTQCTTRFRSSRPV